MTEPTPKTIDILRDMQGRLYTLEVYVEVLVAEKYVRAQQDEERNAQWNELNKTHRVVVDHALRLVRQKEVLLEAIGRQVLDLKTAEGII